jgi:hypothetical protein
VALAVSEAAAAPDAELEALTVALGVALTVALGVALTVALGVALTVALGVALGVPEPVLGAEAVLLLVAPRD